MNEYILGPHSLYSGIDMRCFWDFLYNNMHKSANQDLGG